MTRDDLNGGGPFRQDDWIPDLKPRRPRRASASGVVSAIAVIVSAAVVCVLFVGITINIACSNMGMSAPLWLRDIDVLERVITGDAPHAPRSVSIGRCFLKRCDYDTSHRGCIGVWPPPQFGQTVLCWNKVELDREIGTFESGR